MYEDEIKIINEWFDDEERSYDTGYDEEGEYSVGTYDMDDFSDFLRENFPDLIGISCMVGSMGIWFKRSDLENARSC